MLTGLKVTSWHVNVYFIDQNIMQRQNFIELKFEVIEMQNGNMPTDRAQRAGERAQEAQMSMSNRQE